MKPGPGRRIFRSDSPATRRIFAESIRKVSSDTRLTLAEDKSHVSEVAKSRVTLCSLSQAERVIVLFCEQLRLVGLLLRKVTALRGRLDQVSCVEAVDRGDINRSRQEWPGRHARRAGPE
jgi:hypothetical protein